MKSKKYKTNKNLIKKAVVNSKKTALFIGISGGIDSAVCLRMLIDWFGKDMVKPIYLPIETHTNVSEIKLLSEQLGIDIPTVDLTEWFNQTVAALQIKNRDNINNLKPKLRAVYLASQAFEHNGLVVSCLNYDEYYLGYFTKNGDSAGDIYPMLNFCKSEIYKLAKDLQIPTTIINKKPSADLYENQLDEIELQLTYQEIDLYLQFKKVSKQVIDRIKLLKNNNAHKHTLDKFLIENGLRKT